MFTDAIEDSEMKDVGGDQQLNGGEGVDEDTGFDDDGSPTRQQQQHSPLEDHSHEGEGMDTGDPLRPTYDSYGLSVNSVISIRRKRKDEQRQSVQQSKRLRMDQHLDEEEEGEVEEEVEKMDDDIPCGTGNSGSDGESRLQNNREESGGDMSSIGQDDDMCVDSSSGDTNLATTDKAAAIDDTVTSETTKNSSISRVIDVDSSIRREKPELISNSSSTCQNSVSDESTDNQRNIDGESVNNCTNEDLELNHTGTRTEEQDDSHTTESTEHMPVDEDKLIPNSNSPESATENDSSSESSTCESDAKTDKEEGTIVSVNFI